MTLWRGTKLVAVARLRPRQSQVLGQDLGLQDPKVHLVLLDHLVLQDLRGLLVLLVLLDLQGLLVLQDLLGLQALQALQVLQALQRKQLPMQELQEFLAKTLLAVHQL